MIYQGHLLFPKRTPWPRILLKEVPHLAVADPCRQSIRPSDGMSLKTSVDGTYDVASRCFAHTLVGNGCGGVKEVVCWEV